jgi:glycosyltransferase involved in cell wall biosynthesis
MRLSVIIPFYNVEEYLERCIISVENQDIVKEDYEVLLINDGSTDKSYEIACRLKDTFTNVVVLTQENKGQGAARNLGLKEAKGNYVLFVDSDDYMLSNVFCKMLDAVDCHDLDILIMQSKSMKEDGSFRQIYSAPFPKGSVINGQQILVKGYRPASVWAKLYRRELISDTIGGFKEGIIHEDVDFNMKLFSYAQRAMFLDLCCYVYYWNSMSTDKLMNYNKIIKSLSSDVIIAGDFMKFSLEKHLEAPLPVLFKKQANSIIVSTCYSLISRYKHLSFSDKMYVVEMIKEYKLLPIKGETNSIKSDRYIKIVNCTHFMSCIFRVQSILYKSNAN